MISSDVETRALQFLADDEFCSPFEIATVVALWDGNVDVAPVLIAAWQQRGWVELLSQDEPGLPDLLHLTAAGYAEAERRRAAS